MGEFIVSELGHLNRGDVVVVNLSGSAANVRLLDSSNYSKYKHGQRHHYCGGLAKRSPVRLAVPHTGRWYAVVDMQGLRGQVRAGFSVIPGSAVRPLPPIREHHDSLTEIADNVMQVQAEDADREFDVFISHATEDKDAIVRPLALALREHDLAVWYDEFELKIGDSLRRKIDVGIARSRFGIVVVSHAFFAKSWPQYELDGLVTMAMTGKQIILPLWHEISKDDVVRQSPSLADKVALRTSDYTIQQIADEIAAVVLDRVGTTDDE